MLTDIAWFVYTPSHNFEANYWNENILVTTGFAVVVTPAPSWFGHNNVGGNEALSHSVETSVEAEQAMLPGKMLATVPEIVAPVHVLSWTAHLMEPEHEVHPLCGDVQPPTEKSIQELAHLQGLPQIKIIRKLDLKIYSTHNVHRDITWLFFLQNSMKTILMSDFGSFDTFLVIGQLVF